MSLTDSHVVDSMTSSTEHHQVRAKIRRQFQNKKGIKGGLLGPVRLGCVPFGCI